LCKAHFKKPNCKTNPKALQTKNVQKEGEMSLSTSESNSCFWLTREEKIYPKKMKSLIHETPLCSQIFTGK
jgi:hypothetical protein